MGSAVALRARPGASACLGQGRGPRVRLEAAWESCTCALRWGPGPAGILARGRLVSVLSLGPKNGLGMVIGFPLGSLWPPAEVISIANVNFSSSVQLYIRMRIRTRLAMSSVHFRVCGVYAGARSA